MENSEKTLRIFYEHLEELAIHSDRDFRPYYTNFLPREYLPDLERIAAKYHVFCTTYGGVENTERIVACFSPEDIIPTPDDFPIQRLTFHYHYEKELTHRDFLGVLMGCRLERECIGDILIKKNIAQVYVLENVVPVILGEVTQIGHTGVSITQTDPPLLTPEHTMIPLSGTIASLRADAIVAYVTHLNRKKSVTLIRSGKMRHGLWTIESPSTLLQVGDIFSIRGYGKYRIDTIGDLTKKGRYHIIIQKYQ